MCFFPIIARRIGERAKKCGGAFDIFSSSTPHTQGCQFGNPHASVLQVDGFGKNSVWLLPDIKSGALEVLGLPIESILSTKRTVSKAAAEEWSLFVEERRKGIEEISELRKKVHWKLSLSWHDLTIAFLFAQVAEETSKIETDEPEQSQPDQDIDMDVAPSDKKDGDGMDVDGDKKAKPPIKEKADKSRNGGDDGVQMEDDDY